MQGLFELRDTAANYTSTKKNYNYNSEYVMIRLAQKN